MTQPISNDELTELIKYHRNTLWSHRWQMTPAAEQAEKQTIQALEHYRDLINVIDGREPEPDPFQEQPSLPPADAPDQEGAIA